MLLVQHMATKASSKCSAASNAGLPYQVSTWHHHARLRGGWSVSYSKEARKIIIAVAGLEQSDRGEGLEGKRDRGERQEGDRDREEGLDGERDREEGQDGIGGRFRIRMHLVQHGYAHPALHIVEAATSPPGRLIPRVLRTFQHGLALLG